MAKDFSKYTDYNPVMDFLDKALEIETIKTTKKPVLKKLSDITQIAELRNIFPRNDKVYKTICSSIIKDGYDDNFPIIIWLWNGSNVVVEGNTRFEAAAECGIEKIPCFEVTFDSMEQAIEYAKKAQLARRNLSQQEIFYFANEVAESEYGNGRDVEIKADRLGISPSTIQHAKTVAKKAASDVVEAVKNGEMSINEAYKTVKKRPVEKDKSTDERLSSNDGIPSNLNFSHTDGIERPSYSAHSENETDIWIKEKNLQCETEHKKGFAEGFEIGLYFALAEIKKGRTPEEVLSDERVSDLSYQVISTFKLTEEDENIITEMI